ncbi:class I SAM-dependent methyltransferase [Candidatus Saccharibacteria bacterium]|nr:class I SAM-dependent methyltransferase [Candidatus Saccharibacteria bacterium]
MSWKNDQVSKEETERIIELAKDTLKVAGDFVELGCYKGDTSLLLAEVLKGSAKKLWIYDSFEGLPEKSLEDESVLGVNFKGGELFVTKREVKERFLRAGLPVPVVKKGWFSELTDEDLPKEIAFAFLDGDFYESIQDSLKLVVPRMNKDGMVIVHDYSNPALPGVKKAVDEFKMTNKIKMILL